jgi:hypothetical protein
LPANAGLKTCKHSKVIHAFTRELLTFHLFFVPLALGKALPRGVEIALFATSKTSSTIHVYFRLKISRVASCLLDWLTAGLIPLPLQPVGGCVKHRIILKQDIFAPLQSTEARQHVLALLEAIRPFSLHGSSF